MEYGPPHDGGGMNSLFGGGGHGGLGGLGGMGGHGGGMGLMSLLGRKKRSVNAENHGRNLPFKVSVVKGHDSEPVLETTASTTTAAVNFAFMTQEPPWHGIPFVRRK